MINGESLRLLVIEESESDAESLANILRNAGQSVQLTFAADTDTLESILNAQQPDMVLCGSSNDIPDYDTVRTTLEKHETSSPMICLAEETSETAVIAARKSGITALISYDQPEYLQLLVQREIDILDLQHKLEEVTASVSGYEKRCHDLIENSSDAVAYIHEGMHVYANHPYMDMFGIDTRTAVEGTPILDMITRDERDAFKDFLRNFGDGEDSENTLNIDCINPQGARFNSVMEFTPTTMDGEPCTQVIIRAKLSNADLEEKIETLSRQDILTSLFNRQHFMEVLGENIDGTGAEDEEKALIYILVDNFKSIRENFGIAASDLLLCDISRLIEDQCKKRDIVARFGEYAFTILYHDSSKEKIQATGEKLLHDIAGHICEVEDQAITTTCSVGICAINEYTSSAQNVLSRADLACEVARSSGGNQIHTHSIAVDEQLSEDQAFNRDSVIRETIDEERFYLVYQPIVSLKGDSGERYEVLLRIIDKEDHVILPGQFLSIAENIGLGGEIDRWIINTAFKELAKLRNEGGDISFYIKLSGTTLMDAELPGWINAKLKEYRLVSDGVVFEIPERTAVNDLKNSIVFVKAMQKLHCKVALEHFGCTDQPQLLKHVHANVLKIDGSLIEGLAGNKENQARVQGIVDLARTNEITCIAERVDDAADLAKLWQYGVDFIQGNFVQEPSKEHGYDFEGEIA